MMIGIDVSASGPDKTAYAVRDPDTGEFISFSLPDFGEWRFLPWRDCFVAVNPMHPVLLIKLRGGGPAGLSIERIHQ